MWRCLSEGIFGNGKCKEQPEFNKEPIESGTGYVSMGSCKLKPETCGKYLSWKEYWESLPEEERQRTLKPKTTEEVVKIDRQNGEIVKSKSKAAKKLEAEISQGSMF